MKLASSEEMRKIDKEAIEGYGIPGIVLMENAGLKVCKHVLNIHNIADKSICIICGKGNNGGDGFVIARHLSFKCKNVVTYLVGSEDSLKGDALTNYNIAKKMNLNIKYVKDNADINMLINSIKESDVLIDGLLGTGVRGEVTGIYRDIIKAVNDFAGFVISIDIPSGIDADTGYVLGEGIKAHKTVTFALPKIGLYTYPGAEYAGEVIVEDISIPENIIFSQDISINLLDYKDIIHLFPKRIRDSNKGTYGRVYIIGGSDGMMGAVSMSALSALRCGAGIVELGVPYCIQNSVAPLVMEAIVRGLDEEEGKLSLSSAERVLESFKMASSFAFGPGIGKSSGLLKLLDAVVSNARVSGVIDADGLNLLSLDTEILSRALCTMVLTPHPGEMARLIKKDIGYVQRNRIECAKAFSQKYKVVTLLKGAGTVISSPSGEVFVNSTGNPGMAKGGSGDVLTGMIASFIAQGIDTFDAAKAAAYIHGRAGDMAVDELGEYAVKAGDIIDYIPNAIKGVCEGR